MLSVWSNGYDLSGLGPSGVVGDLEWSTTFQRSDSQTGGGGLLVMTFRLFLPTGFTHPALRRQALVTLKAGSLPLGHGLMAEPNRDEWTFTVDGLFRSAEWTAAVDASRAPSTNVRTVVVEAIARGRLPGWKYVTADLPNVSVSTTSEASSNLNYVADVLNEYCRQNNKVWWIDQFGYVQITDLPTTPTLAFIPGVPAMATADDDYASGYFGRYQSATGPDAFSSVDVDNTAAAARYGGRESLEDFGDLGLMSSGDATTLLQSIADANGARPNYSQAVEVTREQVTTLGGTCPELWQHGLAPQMVRHHGWLDDDGALAYGKTREWVIGSTQHKANERTFIAAPIGLVARTQASVIKAQWQKTREGFK